MSNHHAEYFDALHNLATTASEPDSHLADVIEAGRTQLNLDAGGLAHTADGEYTTIKSVGLDPAEPPLGKTWCRHVLGGHRHIAVADAGASVYADDVARTATGYECYLGTPIRVYGKLYGTLWFGASDPRETAFSEAEIRFVELLAEQISHALERETHDRAIAEQHERAEEFASVLAHDLRNPLTSAIGYTELALESAPAEISAYLETVLDSLERIQATITDALALLKQAETVGERLPIKLGVIAQDTWDRVEPDGATLVIENDRTIRADPDRLGLLFEKLFANVGDHCEAVTVTIRGTDDGFEVTDDGPGLPDPVVRSLFEDTHDGDRPGAGLLIVERIATGHGWTGSVRSDDTGTRFAFSGVESTTEVPA